MRVGSVRIERWPTDVASARTLQEQLRGRVIARDMFPRRVRFVAGVDVSFDRTSPMLFGAVVVPRPRASAPLRARVVPRRGARSAIDRLREVGAHRRARAPDAGARRLHAAARLRRHARVGAAHARGHRARLRERRASHMPRDRAAVGVTDHTSAPPERAHSSRARGVQSRSKPHRLTANSLRRARFARRPSDRLGLHR